MTLAHGILERLKEHLALPGPDYVSPRERVVMVVYPPSSLSECAVQRRCFPAGANPARPLSLRPEATGAVMEETKWLKPLV